MREDTVYLPWVASDYLDWGNYKGNKAAGILDSKNRIVVNYDAELTYDQAKIVAGLVNEGGALGRLIQNMKLMGKQSPAVFKLLLKVLSNEHREKE